MRKRQYDPCQPQRLQQHDVCIFALLKHVIGASLGLCVWCAVKIVQKLGKCFSPSAGSFKKIFDKCCGKKSVMMKQLTATDAKIYCFWCS